MKGLYEVTVNRGEDIRQVISDYILEKGWEEVFIVGAVGSIIDSAYNAPIDNSIPMNLATNECPGAAELLSFNGEVMKRERMDENLAKVYPCLLYTSSFEYWRYGRRPGRGGKGGSA